MSMVGTSGRAMALHHFTLPLLKPFLRAHYSPSLSRKSPRIIRAEVREGEPDWEAEMSIFKKRTMKPSQLEALRKLEAGKVDVGRVSRSPLASLVDTLTAPGAERRR